MTRTWNLLLLILALMTCLPTSASAWNTLLHRAAHGGRLSEVKRLLEAGADVNAKDNDGNPPLHLASNYGHAEVVKILLEAGANVDAKGNYRETPLHMASYYGHAEVVKVLLASGAKVNAKKTTTGRRPCMTLSSMATRAWPCYC